MEHACVTATLQELSLQGVDVEFLPAGLHGAVQVEQVAEAIRPDTRCITLMAVNNETGVKTDWESIAALAQEHRIPFFVDGVALLGKEFFSLPKGVTGIAFSGHKIHAPQGIGCVIIHPHYVPHPLITGGGQEQGRRGGTENVLGILAFAEAIRCLEKTLTSASIQMAALRDRFEKTISQALPNVTVNGTGPRVANVSNLSFYGVNGESLLFQLDLEGIAVSHGSACSSGALEPSRVFTNMGLPKELADSAIRFSLSRFTTEAEMDQAAQVVIRSVSRLRDPKNFFQQVGT